MVDPGIDVPYGEGVNGKRDRCDDEHQRYNIRLDSERTDLVYTCVALLLAMTNTVPTSSSTRRIESDSLEGLDSDLSGP